MEETAHESRHQELVTLLLPVQQMMLLANNRPREWLQVLEAADVVARFSSFVEALSGHEGAELPEVGCQKSLISGTASDITYKQPSGLAPPDLPTRHFPFPTRSQLSSNKGRCPNTRTASTRPSRHLVPYIYHLNTQPNVLKAEKPVVLDAQRLLGQLRRTLGMGSAGPGEDMDMGGGSDGSDDSEGSSFFSDDGDDEEDDEEEDGEGGEANAGFMAELERQMGQASQSGMHASASEFSRATAGRGPASREAAGGAGSSKLRELQTAWEVGTATDSDDDAGDDGLSLGSHSQAGDSDDDGGSDEQVPGTGEGFDGMYMHVLEQQLRGTRMAETFERAAQPGAAAEHGKRDAAGNEKEVPEDAGGGGDKLTPVDLDMNLVKNLLRSAAAQHGLAGPATNLAGMLGLNLPQGMDEADVAKL